MTGLVTDSSTLFADIGPDEDRGLTERLDCLIKNRVKRYDADRETLTTRLEHFVKDRAIIH